METLTTTVREAKSSFPQASSRLDSPKLYEYCNIYIDRFESGLSSCPSSNPPCALYFSAMTQDAHPVI